MKYHWIIIVIIVILFLKFNCTEGLASVDLTTTATKNRIANMVNSPVTTTGILNVYNKLKLGNDVILSAEDGNWLTVKNREGEFGKGVAAKKLFFNDSLMTNIGNVNFNNPKGPIMHTTSGLKIGSKNNDTFIDRKYYTVFANYPGPDAWAAVPKSHFNNNIDEAIKYCKYRQDCIAVTENNNGYWFKNMQDPNFITWGKNLPDDFYVTGNLSDVVQIPGKESYVVSNFNACKKDCKDSTECNMAIYRQSDKNCWLKKNATSDIKTHFLNKVF